MRRFLIVLAACLAVATCRAQTSPSLEELSTNVFRIGAVKLDKQAKTVSFPAEVEMRDGLVEYALVTVTGKSYESVLVTKVKPLDVHLAMLLLGEKGGGDTPNRPPEQINAAYLKTAPGLTGGNIEVSVTWKEGGTERHAALEDFIFNRKQQAPMAAGAWLYNGSVLYNGNLLAQTDGSIIAIVTDPAALINNPRPGHDDDTIWAVKADKLPAVGTAVEVTIKIQPSTGEPTPPTK